MWSCKNNKLPVPSVRKSAEIALIMPRSRVRVPLSPPFQRGSSPSTSVTIYTDGECQGSCRLIQAAAWISACPRRIQDDESDRRPVASDTTPALRICSASALIGLVTLGEDAEFTAMAFVEGHEADCAVPMFAVIPADEAFHPSPRGMSVGEWQPRVCPFGRPALTRAAGLRLVDRAQNDLSLGSSVSSSSLL